MAGSALSLFTDFFTHTTGPAYLARKEIQGGTTIKDMILLDDPLTASTYLPGASASVTNVQGGSTISVPWRFIRVPITWTEAEILLNESGGGDIGQFHQFKNLRDFKYQQAYTSLMNLLERKMVATANNGQMEANAGSEPYSIFATLTADGLAPSGFTTVQGINPTTKSKWRNQTASWTFTTPYDIDNGVIAGFDTMSQLVVFERPPTAQQYFTEDEFRRHVIFTTRAGRRYYMKAVRANNDITRAGPQDPSFGKPVFLNIPVVNNEGYDDASVFTNDAGDGYTFINMNHLKLIFHREKWLQVSEPMVFPDKPDTVVVWVDVYCNLFNCSRQRHGYLKAA
jgi:hypothetical protein